MMWRVLIITVLYFSSVYFRDNIQGNPAHRTPCDGIYDAAFEWSISSGIHSWLQNHSQYRHIIIVGLTLWMEALFICVMYRQYIKITVLN